MITMLEEQQLTTYPESPPLCIEDIELRGMARYAEVAVALRDVVDMERLAHWGAYDWSRVSPDHRQQVLGLALRDVVQLPDFYSDDAVRVSPLEPVGTGWEHLQLFDKFDTAQQIRTFKVRGAHAGGEAIMRGHPETRHLVTFSAGNHGLGLALYVKGYNERLVRGGTVRLGLDGEVSPEDRGKLLTGHIFVKDGASPDKVLLLRAFERYGVQLHVGGESLEDARGLADGFVTAANQRGTGGEAHMVHPYSQPAVMAGQATVLAETYLQLRAMGVDLDATTLLQYCGTGGGGLAGGMAVLAGEMVKRGLLRPGSHVVAAQMEYCDSLVRALARYDQGVFDLHDLFMVGDVDTFDASADGTAVRDPDPSNVALAHYLQKMGLLRVVTVGKSMVARSMERDKHADRPPREPAGALGCAGRNADLQGWRPYWIADSDGSRKPAEPGVLVAVVSGGNMSAETRDDFRRALSAGQRSVLGGIAFA